jgi:Domain of unknown function (DUF4160)
VAALQRHVAHRKRNAGRLLATLFIAAHARTTWASALFDFEVLHALKLQYMPVVFRYKSFRFFFYSNEGNPREAMHVHVRGSDGEAKFWLTPTVYLADSDGFDARTLRELQGVVTANKELIERTWNEHFA